MSFKWVICIHTVVTVSSIKKRNTKRKNPLAAHTSSLVDLKLSFEVYFGAKYHGYCISKWEAQQDLQSIPQD